MCKIFKILLVNVKNCSTCTKNITIRDIPYMYGKSKRSGKLLNLIAAVEIFLSMLWEMYYSMNYFVKNISAEILLTLEQGECISTEKYTILTNSK